MEKTGDSHRPPHTKPRVSRNTVWSLIENKNGISASMFLSVLVISAFVSFSITHTSLDYLTMSWWLIKWRTWRTKPSRSRMPLLANWNGRTLKWLYVVTITHIVFSLSVQFDCLTQGSHYFWTENWTRWKGVLRYLCTRGDVCKVQVLAKGVWCL